MNIKAIVGAFIVISCLTQCSSKKEKAGCAEKFHVKDVYTMLDTVIAGRKMQLAKYLETTREKANAIKHDKAMFSFFKTMREYYYLSNKVDIPPRIEQKTQKLMQSIKEHYINEYLLFYDILFIDRQGDIFYTIRKQEDYKKNIFSAQLAQTALSKKMKSDPTGSFVDFQFYEISGEPSAFFIEPVMDNEGVKGWFVLQFAINKINNIFAVDEQLGATGEVFLVNKGHFMLTDSRFKASSTILKQKLSHENIQSKFNEAKGHKVVVDYMGNRAMSSFEVFSYFGSEWLIIAKINEDEVITRYYKEHGKCLNETFQEILANEQPSYYQQAPNTKHVIEVDMDEFQRADSNEVLYTHGVTSCTVILITYPGRFSYLAHISPYDKIYGENKTDILGQMLKRITYLEILKSEKQDLEFVVVSPGKKTIGNIVNRLVDEGYFLSQVKFLNNPKALYANVKNDFPTHKTLVYWKMKNANRSLIVQKTGEVKSLGEKFREELKLKE